MKSMIPNGFSISGLGRRCRESKINLVRSVYEISDIALIPVHLIVIPELPMEFEEEFEKLK